MKIRELLAEEKRWCHGAIVRSEDVDGEQCSPISSWGAFAKDADGEPCDPASTAAFQWCLLGAAVRCYDGKPKHLQTVLALEKKAKERGFGTVAAWQDAPERTFAEVKTLVDELDI